MRTIEAKAQEAGLPPWALRHAKRREGIACRYKGFGPGGHWTWAHPALSSPSERDNLEDHAPAFPPPVPPRCAWKNCGEPPQARGVRYCQAHARRARQDSKNRWKRRHAALVREAMARLRTLGRAPQSRERAHLLEVVRVGRTWLDVPDPVQRRAGLLHTLALIEDVLSGRLSVPSEQAREHGQVARRRVRAVPHPGVVRTGA
jgi:hypothetical protein